ncbi:MAG: DUF2330 domain-containing protein [Myxococcaceae bacterium]|nr:DUF2330 domain-containing protein [Myxococcaceae bacterium]
MLHRLALSLLGVALLLPWPAHAFCGFYVSSAGADLFNDATMVVLMRDGTRTVLSMQNNYRGPTQDFALVIPVPVILKKDMVKTLPKNVFERIDALSSPRLVEYFEPGQCPAPPPMPSSMPPSMPVADAPVRRDLGVKIEAKFEVGEYEILILSAKEALGLEIWLKENKYKIPANAAPLLAPYIQNNWKFFVAKVNAKKVTFVDGQAVLSPLRFHYDAEKFELPIRLGLANSAGTQDLVVHVISKQRYELANRPNVLVPTNVEVTPAVEGQFGPFYASIIEKTFEKNPEAAITEFAWKGAMPPPQVMVNSGIYGVTCDPCPPPHPVDDPLTRFLGADVMPGVKTDEDVAKYAREATLTRLHLRYGKDTAKDDLVFRITDPIAGGVPDKPRPTAAKDNRFQGRFIMWKPFDPSRCWSGMMGGGIAMPPGPMPTPIGAPAPATPSNMSKPGKLTASLESYLKADVPELGLKAMGGVKKGPQDPKLAPKSK